MKKILYSAAVLCATFFSSCNYLDVTPVGKVIPEYTEEFRALMTASYQKVPPYKSLMSLRTDELQLPSEYSWSYDTYFNICIWNDANPSPQTTSFHYDEFYNGIFYANHVIAEESKIKDDGSEPIAQIVAEAYAMRAYMHFLLVSIYGQPYSQETLNSKSIPLSLKIDIEQEYPRALLSDVYQQIDQDIVEAESRMQKQSQTAPLNYRFSKESLEALRARIALYKSDWNNALTYAKSVLAVRSELEDLNDQSAKAPYHFQSKESILATVQFVDMDIQSDLPITKELVSKYNQEGDKRFALYFKNSYGDYKVIKGGKGSDKCEIRVSELYLIAAEAAANLNKDAEAKEFLLALTQKRLTPEFFATEAVRVQGLNHDQLIAEIADERQREFAVEGQRWFDLRRTTRPRIVKSNGTTEFVLEQNDPKYTIRFPKSAVANNPLLKD
ncbi:MAG: RagB/SusD family nutrient uptake outer membrane protein [Bacteroidales bacterium]